MSPQANTPASLVMNDASRATLLRGSSSTPSSSSRPGALGAEEAHREQHELARQLEVGALDLLEPAVDHLDLVRPQRAHVAVVVVDEALGVHAVDALAALFVRRRDLEDVGERGPRVGGRPRVGRRGQDLELVHRRRALAMRGAEAVGAGVAAADDHDALALGGDRRRVDVALLHAVAVREVLHRLVDATVLATGDRQVAPRGRATGEHDGVVVAPQLLDRDVDADVRVHAELGALGLHLLDATVEVALLHLELGDAVAQEAADAVGAFEHDDVVARARELLRGREARGPGADDRDPLARLHRGVHRGDPPLVPRAVDDLDLDLLDRDRVLVDAEHARRLARRRAQATGELGEVVGGVEPLDRVAPVVAVDEVVPVGDEVAERAAVVAERDAAVHAAPGLGHERVARRTARRPRSSRAGAPAPAGASASRAST